MNVVSVSWCLCSLPFKATAMNDARQALALYTQGSRVVCEVSYREHESPLLLSAAVSLGDEVQLVLFPYRLELYVNGQLRDEEWPHSECLWNANIPIDTTAPLQIAPYSSLVSSSFETFVNAEGWRPADEVFVGDCMPYVKDDTFHVLYLKDRRHHASKWGFGAHQWEHIATTDFVRWTVYPTAVPITDHAEGSICTGSWIAWEDTEYLFYTVRTMDGSAAPVKRSISRDGIHFEKDTSFSFTLPARYCAASARDPKVIRDQDGVFHMFVTTGLVAENRGCLAHMVSTDLNIWYDTGTPLVVCEDADEPECPDYIVYGGRYYLIYSVGGTARYRVSDRPFDGWVVPPDDRIPCDRVPKGAVWRDRVVFAGFAPIGRYAGTMSFCTAVCDEHGFWQFQKQMG